VARIFLCHASEDKAQVREVYHQLKALGFEPWLDEVDILPGQDWEYEIEQALETSDFVMVFLSTRSVEKVGYVQREFRRALYKAEEMPEGFVHTIPVKLDDCAVPRRFSHHQWANLYEAGAFDRIVRALQYGLQQRGQPLPEPLVHAPPSAPPRTSQPKRKTPPSTPSVLPDAGSKTWTNSIGMEFVLIPAGTFMMGSPDSDAEASDMEKPAHRVTISQPFYLGKYLVTQGQWEAVMGKENNPSQFKGDANRPVEHVSWEDVQQFIDMLNTREGGTQYRLPTEAEWEYACRAGSQTAYSFGDDPRQLDTYGWYQGNSERHTHPVRQKRPNAWGLYDMHGNVYEWVQDWYGGYAAEPVTDPQGPASGSDRVLRSGSWNDNARYCRAASRVYDASCSRNEFFGFRLLRTAL
jgi:formylglycine-generating enzyme required for sulfatase activity